MSMRRKSERNKAKGSPEKKVEKPTRKSTRRRGKRSPSTSPEIENTEETPAAAPTPVAAVAAVAAAAPAPSSPITNVVVSQTEPENTDTTVQTRLQVKEVEQPQVLEVAEEKVTSSEQETKAQSPGDEEENNGTSVWKVARADASPGEIQKLKLCRQRNTSEASSEASVSRKKSSGKWQESGEGFAGEVDSADEQLVSCMRMPSGIEQPNDPSSSYPGQDSNEEVSDSKEILPETTSANLSDDKPNIDRQGDTNEACCSDREQNIDSEPGSKPSSASAEPSALRSNGDFARDTEETATVVVVANEDKPTNEDASEKSAEPSGKEEDSTENARRETSSDEDDTNDNDKRKERRSEDTSSESNDEARGKGRDNNRDSARTPSRTGRRKHRNKYRDSSNSETPDSEEEPSLKRKNKETYDEEAKTVVEDAQEEKEELSSPDRRANSVLNNMDAMEIEHSENDKQISGSLTEKAENTVLIGSQTPAVKPAKVNLKRSFSARILAERNDIKREETDTNANTESANQNKENHNSAEQEPKCAPRKRRWGTALSTDTAPSFAISTDSLKAIVPGAKPLPINEVRLSKDDDEDRDRHRDMEKRHNSTDSISDHKSKEDGLTQKNGATKKGDSKLDNHIAARRKISIVKETPHLKSPSPPASKPTNILLIKNLVRPFTLNQIKELLSRTGTIVENGFWMDRIKSKCFVEYSNEDQAFETRQALHGISWPVSNPKRLYVEYATKEDIELARELSKDQPVQRKTEPLIASDSWQQDWGQERANATKVVVVREWDLGKEDGQQHVKEKERDKKEHDKKRRQRSRSPALEAHLPAPARKFKKKEDEPPPAKLLDDLFRKTKATPCIYWLPLTNEQIVVKEEMRRQHMAEHARRLEEMRRAERNRDGRRRRSPRK